MSSMDGVSQEMLSAWLDGALDEGQAAELEAQLAQSVQLQQTLGLMMVNERRMRSEIQRMVGQRPVPKSLSALLEEPGTERGVSMSQRLRDWLQPTGFGPGWAAASVVTALLVGVFAGNQMGPPSACSPPSLALQSMTIESGQASFALLETRAAGDRIELGENLEAKVAFSFQNNDGRWCRQFEQYDLRFDQSVAAVACRNAEVWQIELLQKSTRPVTDAGHFRAASGDGLEALDSYVMQHGNGEILVGQPEAELIRRGWH